MELQAIGEDGVNYSDTRLQACPMSAAQGLHLEFCMSCPSYSSPSIQNSFLPRPGWYAALKRPVDVVLILVGLVVSFPLLVLGAVLVKLTSRGPIFYSQIRLGQDGQPFWI